MFYINRQLGFDRDSIKLDRKKHELQDVCQPSRAVAKQ